MAISYALYVPININPARGDAGKGWGFDLSAYPLCREFEHQAIHVTSDTDGLARRLLVCSKYIIIEYTTW